jgi:glycosyltransferase involved in cell wall biosynthesis
MDTPNISIIIPVYNIEQYISRCIDSVLSQTFTDFECILIDDCSRDRSPEICDEYALKDNRIKTIHNKKNVGASLSRKTGLDNAAGEYIQFIDGDDWIENNMLEIMRNKIVSEDYDMVYCDFYRYNASNTASYEKVPELSVDTVKNIRESILGFNAGCSLWNKLIKKQLYGNIIFPRDSYGEDKYINTQVLYRVKSIGYTGNALYNYRFNQNSLKNNLEIKLSSYQGLSKNFKNISNFLKSKYNGDLGIFEPEFSIRKKFIEAEKYACYKWAVKRILRIFVPFMTGKKLLRYAYNKLKKCQPDYRKSKIL